MIDKRECSKRRGDGEAFGHSLSTLIALFVLAAVYFVTSESAWCAPAPKKIVLIGGPKSHGVGEHDFPNGVRALRDILQSSPDVQAIETLTIDAYPDGWPDSDLAFNNAATIVWYFDGLDQHPLLDAARRATFARLMSQGVGLIALHQASTVPKEDTKIPLGQWLGAVRYGLFDRATETVQLTPRAHPISRGVTPFIYTDEFYPTLKFYGDDGHITPILIGKFHVQFREGRNQIIDKPTVTPAAWAFERDNGGRAFGFTGLHYVENLDQPQLRILLLNAILWTAHIEVPTQGTRSGLPEAAKTVLDRESGGTERTVTNAAVSHPSDNEVVTYPWGKITWFVSRRLRNSDTMTIGEVEIDPGQQNPRHFHPNCDEVLHVERGRILHTMNDKSVEMRAGDTVSIPQGVMHNAKNIGNETAVMSISFSSADRQVVGE